MIAELPYAVLFVDDEPSILKSMTRLFRGAHFNTLTAESGEAALDIIRSRPIQVLVTDYRMPGMSGLELLREAKDIDFDIVRIMISGHSDLGVVLAAVNESELFRFVSKPWDDLELKVTINLALAHRKLIAEKQVLAARLGRHERTLHLLRTKYPDLVEEVEHDPITIESFGRK